MSALGTVGGASGSTATKPPDRPEKRRWTPYWLLLPAMAWLGIFFVVPMVFLGSQSLQTGSFEDGTKLTWNFSIYWETLQGYWPHYARSIGFAALATVFALLIGYPLAYMIAHKSGRWKNILLVLVIAPFFTSFLIRTLAWKTILSSGGPVVWVFQQLHITDLLQWLHLTESNTLLASPFAVVAGLTYNFLPFMVLPLYASLDRLDSRLLEAAGDLYSRPIVAFRRVTLPLSMPGVVAGTLLTFIPAAGDYINSVLLGNTRSTMIGQAIDGQFLRVLDYPQAATMSFILLIIILVIVLTYVRRSGTEELV